MTNKRNMTKTELKKIEAKKRAEQIAKAQERNKVALAKRMDAERKRYEEFYKNNETKLKAYWARKLQIKLNKVKKSYQNKQTDTVKKVRKQEVKKRIPTTIKQLAIEQCQKRAKLSRTKSDGTIYMVDIGQYLHRSEAVAGHYRPKGKYPHMIFIIDNIMPITSKTNYIQADTVGHIRQKQYIAQIGAERYKELEAMADNKALKAEIRDRKYFQFMYDTFLALNEERKRQLGKYYKKP